MSAERGGLIEGDPAIIQKGLKLLETRYVFEGPSYPDAYLATSDAVIVVEGKRTETGPTTSTTWMPTRLQILRHMDAALELTGPRALWGFVMVEAAADGSVPQVWVDACAQTLSPDYLDQSLPHRPPELRQAIAEAFLGVTTWQRAGEELGVPLSELPLRSG